MWKRCCNVAYEWTQLNVSLLLSNIITCFLQAGFRVSVLHSANVDDDTSMWVLHAQNTECTHSLTHSTLNPKPQSPFTGYITTCLTCNLTQKNLLLQVALACIAQSADSRPKMKQVAEFFEQLQPSSWHTHREYHVMCSSTISRFTVMMLMLNPCTMNESPTFIRINHFLLSRPPQVSKRQASRTRLANVMDGYHLKVLRHLTVSTTCGLKFTPHL